MRGSPLLQFVFLISALLASGMGLSRLTAPISPNPLSAAPAITKTEAISTTPFDLVLSAPASLVEIDTGKLVRPPINQSPVTGTLDLDMQNPRIALVVHWKYPSALGEHRFAKLTLEVPRQETITHVFDASGDIDDFLELPFPAAR